MRVLRQAFLLIAQSLTGWASLFVLLADFSTCDGGYRDGDQ